MKKKLFISMLIASVIAVGGCGDANNTENQPNQQDEVVEQENTELQGEVNEENNADSTEVTDEGDKDEETTDTEIDESIEGTEMESTENGAVYKDSSSSVNETVKNENESKYDLTWKTNNGSTLKISFNAIPGLGSFDEAESGVWRIIDEKTWFTIAGWDFGEIVQNNKIADMDPKDLLSNVTIIEPDYDTYEVVKQTDDFTIVACDMSRTDCDLCGKTIFIDDNKNNHRYELQLLVMKADKDNYIDMLNNIASTLDITE